MQCTINSLHGFSMVATNGEAGKLKELYFDLKTWAIRYFVIETGNWFSNKKVLITPQALLATDWANRKFPINITKEQIKSNLDIESEKPEACRRERKRHGPYAWGNYGGKRSYAGNPPAAMNFAALVNIETVQRKDNATKHVGDDSPLYSSEGLTGYFIHATDGEIGYAKDFIIDTVTWNIADVVIDTHSWVGGHKIAIPVKRIKEIVPKANKVVLYVSMAFINKEPAFKESLLASGKTFRGS